MILSISFNPVVESKYYVEDLYPRVENMARKKIQNISGKGLLGARILNNLNIDIFTTGFLGGLQGQYIFNRLKDEDIYNEFIAIKDDSKSVIVIIKKDELLTRINEEGPRITREELGAFYELYIKLIDRFDIIISQDSLPIGLPEDIYIDLINIANKSNKKFILEASERELKYGLEASPFMVKLRKDDLEYLTSLQLDFENEIIKLGNSIVEQGVQLLVIDLDHKGSIVLTQDRGYRLELDKTITKIGEDNGYMVAGFAFGLYKNYDLETIMKLGQATRLVYSMEDDLDRIDMSDIKKYMAKIHISKINY